MILSKYVEVVAGGKNISYFESRGYQFERYWSKKHNKWLIKNGTKIFVKIEDLPKGSHSKIDVKCDYCNNIKHITYKDYLKNHDEELGDCCIKCRPIKHKHTMLERYGVENSSQMIDTIDKTKATNRKKYGCDWQMQSKEVRQKSILTSRKKYGVDYPTQCPEVYEKIIKTRHKNLSNPISKPQLQIYNLLVQKYENCSLEIPCGRYSIDCELVIDGIKIDVEYDGWFWHQDKQRDVKRDNFMIDKGYKVFRIKGVKGDPIPSIEDIDEKIQELLHSSNYVELKM